MWRVSHIISDSDLRSCEAKKAQKNIWGSNGIQAHDLCDTGAMLYQGYEALLEESIQI